MPDQVGMDLCDGRMHMFMSASEILAVWSDRRPSELSGEVGTSPVKALNN